jgi:uncharacterized protein YndB with AHSA1/START domain
MIQLEKSIIIHCPVEEVFAFVDDQRNAPQWQDGLVEVRRTTEGPIGIGTRYTFVRTFMGQRMEGSNQYIEHEPNKCVRFKSTSGPLPFQFAYLTEPAATGTQVTSVMEMQPEGLSEQAEEEMSISLSREMEAALSKLKALLESRANAASF